VLLLESKEHCRVRLRTLLLATKRTAGVRLRTVLLATEGVVLWVAGGERLVAFAWDGWCASDGDRACECFLCCQQCVIQHNRSQAPAITIRSWHVACSVPVLLVIIPGSWSAVKHCHAVQLLCCCVCTSTCSTSSNLPLVWCCTTQACMHVCVVQQLRCCGATGSFPLCYSVDLY
jgi:hypothetical protein